MCDLVTTNAASPYLLSLGFGFSSETSLDAEGEREGPRGGERLALEAKGDERSCDGYGWVEGVVLVAQQAAFISSPCSCHVEALHIALRARRSLATPAGEGN